MTYYDVVVQPALSERPTLFILNVNIHQKFATAISRQVMHCLEAIGVPDSMYTNLFFAICCRLSDGSITVTNPLTEASYTIVGIPGIVPVLLEMGAEECAPTPPGPRPHMPAASAGLLALCLVALSLAISRRCD